MVYEWATGSRLEAKPQEVGERIEQIRTINAGSVTPELLVDDARAEDSPLHSCFEWDDGRAAEKFRLDQARLVLRSIVVSVTEDRRLPVRAFVAIERNDDEGKVYTSVQEALGTDALREQLLNNALREVQSWRRRYSRLKELASVFGAIDQLELPKDNEELS